MTTAERPAEMPPGHGYRGFILRAGLSVAIILFLLWRYDARSIFRIFVPGLIAGDAARVLYLGRRHGRMGGALASIAANRAYGLLGLFWFAAAMVYLFNGGGLPASVTRPILWLGALSLGVYLASPWLATMIPATPRPIRGAIELIAPYLGHPFKIILPLVLSIALQASRSVSQWLLALGLGLHVPMRPFLLVVPIASVFASLPVSLAGLGVREAVYLVLFEMVGVDPRDAVALGLLYFAVTMLAGLTGAMAFVTTEQGPAPAPK